jgi:hypothetical protein
MTLAAGTRLGAYEIVALVGSDGVQCRPELVSKAEAPRAGRNEMMSTK